MNRTRGPSYDAQCHKRPYRAARGCPLHLPSRVRVGRFGRESTLPLVFPSLCVRTRRAGTSRQRRVVPLCAPWHHFFPFFLFSPPVKATTTPKSAFFCAVGPCLAYRTGRATRPDMPRRWRSVQRLAIFVNHFFSGIVSLLVRGWMSTDTDSAVSNTPRRQKACKSGQPVWETICKGKFPYRVRPLLVIVGVPYCCLFIKFD
nr:hypothetical protein [Pandoravirus massiliensis]